MSVTESTERRLSFEFRLDGLRLREFTGPGGRTATAVSFAGDNTDVGEAGDPVLPGVAVRVGVPLSGPVRVRFTPRETRAYNLGAPVRRRDGAYPDAGDMKADFVSPWVSSPRFVTVRGQRLANVVVRPFVYDEATQRLTVCTRGVCTIEFPVSPVSIAPALRPSDFERMLGAKVLNYETARRWRAPLTRSLPKAVSRSDLPASSMYLTFRVGDGNKELREATTNENGLVKVPGSAVAAAFGSRKPIGSIRLLAAPQEELSVVAPAIAELPPGAEEIPVLRVDIDGDGLLDEEDYLVAYTTGTSDWTGYDTTVGRFTFALHHYEDYRHYWVSYSTSGTGLSAAKFTQPTGAPVDTLDRFVNQVLHKESVALPRAAEGGLEWRWALLASGMSRTFSLGLTDAVGAAGGELRIHRSSGSGSRMSVTLNNQPLCDSCSLEDWRGVADWGGQKLTLSLGGVSDTFELDALEYRYHVALDMSKSSRILILSSSDTGVVAYRLSNLPGKRVYLFRIPLDQRQISLVDTIPASRSDYVWKDRGGQGTKYLACTEDAVASPQMETYERRYDQQFLVRNLRARSRPVDYLIITHSTLVNEAVRLAAHKSGIGRFPNVAVVELDDIYREFSGGNQDPAAIRNFLIYAANRWGGAPDYVLLLGNGHYDFKGYTGTREVSFVPPPQFNEKCIEDFYVYLDPAEVATSASSSADASLGRIPCYSAAEAAAVVDKIIETEGASADWGAWRNRVMLVADDDMQGPKVDQISPPHYESSEAVADGIVAGRNFVELSKVYLYEYEWNELQQKPEANRAIVNRINSGVSCVNYFGHGADQLWADEHIFKNEEVAGLRNRKRYPLIGSFSCSVGRFDKPGHESLSDAVVRAASSGAIAALSSTRLAYARENEKLAKSVYEFLFAKDTVTHQPRSIGQAFVAAKLEQQNKNSNQKTYALLGDPSIRFSSLSDTISLAILDVNGKRLDTLKALQTVKITGTVQRNRTRNASFGAGDSSYVHLAVYNPDQDSVRRKDGGGDNSVSYMQPGTPVFVGRARVSAGRFEQTVLLPKKVTFQRPGVKLVAYAWDDTSSGAGMIEGLVFDGTEATSAADAEGPRIMIRPIAGEGVDASVGFTDRIRAPLPLGLEVNLFDKSGIDVVGTGPDEGLTFEMTGVVPRENINHKFQFDDGDYRKGTATVSFEKGDLDPGSYKVRVTGQDLIGNVSRLALDLEVLPDNISDESFSLDHVFVHPNPFRVGGTTRFFFHHTDLYGDIRISIKIYTLSGKLIETFDNVKRGQEWRGTDKSGRRLGPNTYLYRVVAHIPSRQEPVKSQIKKIVIHPPR